MSRAAAFQRCPLEARNVGTLCVATAAGGMALDRVVLALQPRTFALTFDTGLIELCLRRLLMDPALLGEIRKPSAENCYSQRREFDKSLHLLQKLAVVTDDNQAATPALKQAHQPLPTAAVEVIGGLVEHQQWRLTQQCADQSDSGLLATAEVLRQIRPGEVGQPGPIEHLAQALGQIPAFIDEVEVVRSGSTAS